MNNQERKDRLSALKRRAEVLRDDLHLAHGQVCYAFDIAYPENDVIQDLPKYLRDCNVVDSIQAAFEELRRAVRALEKAMAAVDEAEAAMAPAEEGGSHEKTP